MKQIIDYITFLKDSENANAEFKFKLKEICDLESKFIKNLSEQALEAYDLLVDKQSEYQSMELDHIIELTYKFCKDIFLS